MGWLELVLRARTVEREGTLAESTEPSAIHNRPCFLPCASLTTTFGFTQVRTSEQLSQCDALIIPGGESTTISLVAGQTDLLEKLRHFVK